MAGSPTLDSVSVESRALRLDLGCGSRRTKGFVRVDVMARCEPDVRCDLEVFPWPFDDDSVVEVRLHHVLEHLGRSTDVFLSVMKELHRICRDGATIDVRVPHPRHDAFLTDPTHVRPILLGTLAMFSKRQNLAWQAEGHANTPLALHLDVDFEIVSQQLVLDPRWQERVDQGVVDRQALAEAVRSQANVVEEIRATLKVHKDGPVGLARRCMEHGDAASCIDVCLGAADECSEDPELWTLLGTAMLAQGQLEGAELGLRRAVAIAPGRASVWADLALVVRRRGELTAAMEYSAKALAIDPSDPRARTQRAGTLAALGRFDEAVAVSEGLVKDHPDVPGYRSNLGNHLRQARRAEDAVQELRLAAQTAPDDPSIRWNLAMALFQSGQVREGFQCSEARYRRPSVDAPRWTEGAWRGRSGQTLLLETEQGLGDAIQFVRFAKAAARGGTRVVVRAPARLVPLLATAPGVAEAVSRSQDVAHEDIAYLMSVPAILGLGENDLVREEPYLVAEPRRAGRFLDGLPPARLRIGVAWQGNPGHDEDRFRSFPLAALAPVAALSGVQLVSLQRGAGEAQVGGVGFEVRLLGRGLDADGAFLDTAAVLGELDLVIACDSAVAHLAGALGVPCFLALAYAPCWRWVPGAPDTPWYRHHRLFHQPEPHDWGSVFAAITEAVRAWAEGGDPPAPRLPR